MNKRERIRAALNHKEPDKIPIDFAGMHSSGMSGMTYNKLKKYLGINTGSTRIYDVNQQLVIPEQWYLDRFQVDTMDLARFFSFDDDDWIEWNLPDGSPAKFPAWIRLKQKKDSWVILNDRNEIIAKMVNGAFYFTQEIYPYYGQMRNNFDDLKDVIKNISWMGLPDPLWKNAVNVNFFKSLEMATKKLYEETDYCLIANYSSLFFEPGQWLYRNDEFLMKMLLEPKEVTKLFEKLAEFHLNNLNPFLKSVDGYADILIMSDDLGMQTGPLISPKLYRELIFPWHKMIFEYVHKNSNLKTFLHSCGSVYSIIPDLIEAGLDILNPVQIKCNDMNPSRLKKQFGKDIVFWGGGIDTQNVLSFSDTKGVKESVRKNCEIFMKDGGFVFTPIHNMLPGIPPENIVVMYYEVNSMQY
jgi:uroporphyrinogen decarboxylase